MIMRTIMLIFAAMALAGCATSQTLTSVSGGESKVFEAPPYVVKGKAPYDQKWIDSQVEGGVAAFGWPRPAPRPPEIDAPTKPASQHAMQPPKKRSLITRIRERTTLHRKTWPSSGTAAVVSTPVPTLPPAPPPEAGAPDPPAPATPPKPRSDIDELLDPTSPLPIRKVH